MLLIFFKLTAVPKLIGLMKITQPLVLANFVSVVFIYLQRACMYLLLYKKSYSIQFLAIRCYKRDWQNTTCFITMAIFIKSITNHVY